MSNFKNPNELKTPNYVRRAIKKREENIVNKLINFHKEKDAALIKAIDQEARGNFAPLARKLLREHYQLPAENRNDR